MSLLIKDTTKEEREEIVAKSILIRGCSVWKILRMRCRWSAAETVM